MNIIPSTDNTEEYLKQDDVIDYSSEIITRLAGELIGRTDSETQFIKAAYEFVRDKISHSADINEAAEKLLDKINIKNHGLVLMFIGEDANENDAARLVDYITAQNPETEVITVDGGQPVFDYMFVLE